MNKKEIEKAKKEVSTVRVKRLTWINFRAVCLTQQVNATEVLEQLLEEYTMDNAKAAGDHLKRVAARIEASVG